jgi:hypothetical protein
VSVSPAVMRGGGIKLQEFLRDRYPHQPLVITNITSHRRCCIGSVFARSKLFLGRHAVVQTLQQPRVSANATAMNSHDKFLLSGRSQSSLVAHLEHRVEPLALESPNGALRRRRPVRSSTSPVSHDGCRSSSSSSSFGRTTALEIRGTDYCGSRPTSAGLRGTSVVPRRRKGCFAAAAAAPSAPPRGRALDTCWERR